MIDSMDSLIFEEEQIELELEEIQLRKRLNEIRREKIGKVNRNMVKGNVVFKNVKKDDVNKPEVRRVETQLHYTNSTKKRVPVIKEICPDGTIYIRGKCDSKIITHTYSMNSLSWLKQKLPKFAARQKNERNFWQNIAREYSKQFTSISHTKVAELCYFVDSGLADKYFDEYNRLKGKQSTLRGY